MMVAHDRIRLAKYHHRRAVRMLRCASSVETCGHKQAFERLAKECFEARDYQMTHARFELGRRKSYRFEVVTFEGVYDVVAVDELDAGARFESECERHGFNWGPYTVRRIRRERV